MSFSRLEILLIEPYYGGSHQSWADGYRQHSSNQVTLLTLPAQFWKWRMQGGAITLARMMAERDLHPDVILISDMVDLSTFRALTRHQTQNTPIALYFHETQLTYPQNIRQKHGWRYGFINYTSALAADQVFFNSVYHHDVFFTTLPNMLKHFGDYNELETVDILREKSSVLPLGINLRRYDQHQPRSSVRNTIPLFLWNHRWEADKDPAAFFNALYRLDQDGIDFQVALTGECFRQAPTEFEEARRRLGQHIIQYGFIQDFAQYAALLWRATHVISTARHDFFGSAIAEAIYCGCIPVLPDRLNYPNLLPTQERERFLYPSGGLYWALKEHLKNPTTSRDPTRQHLKDYIAQFDWQTMARRYDEKLEALRGKYGGVK